MKIEIVRDAKGKIVAMSEVAPEKKLAQFPREAKQGEHVEEKEIPDRLVSDPDALIKFLSKG